MHRFPAPRQHCISVWPFLQTQLSLRLTKDTVVQCSSIPLRFLGSRGCSVTCKAIAEPYCRESKGE